MIRTGLVIVCVICVATVLSEFLGLGLLWYRGQLTSDTMKDIRSVLKGESPEDFDLAEEEQKAQASSDEVMQQRIHGILELENREDEIALLRTMVDQKRESLVTEQSEFTTQRQGFETRLKALNEQFTTAATEQARGILLALPPQDAVQNLIALELEESVILLKGMPERSIAKILQEFAKSAKADERDRGQAIFEAINRGEPFKKLIGDAEKNLAGEPRIPVND